MFNFDLTNDYMTICVYLKKLFSQKELSFELAILYVMYVIDPGHDDLWWPKKACKPTSAYRKVGKVSFAEFSLHHISNRNKGPEDNKDNK